MRAYERQRETNALLIHLLPRMEEGAWPGDGCFELKIAYISDKVAFTTTIGTSAL